MRAPVYKATPPGDPHCPIQYQDGAGVTLRHPTHPLSGDWPVRRSSIMAGLQAAYADDVKIRMEDEKLGADGVAEQLSAPWPFNLFLPINRADSFRYAMARLSIKVFPPEGRIEWRSIGCCSTPSSKMTPSKR
jgi:hypothetical protein